MFQNTHQISLYFDLLRSKVYKYLESCSMFTAYSDNTQLLNFSNIFFARGAWNKI